MRKSPLTPSHLLPLLLTLLTWACADVEPLPPSLEGAYEEKIPVSPGWRYDLRPDGTYDQWCEFAGTTLTGFYGLPWTVLDGAPAQDTLVLGGGWSDHSPSRRFLVEPWTDDLDVVRVVPLPPPGEEGPWLSMPRVWRRVHP